MNLEAYIQENPNFYEMKISAFDTMKRLHEQALTHTDREFMPEILKRQRPGEADEHYQYRIANYRRLTFELYDQYLSKSVRIFSGNGFRILEASEDLRRFLSETKFMFENRKVDWLEYFVECIYPQSLINPNQLLLFIPYNPSNPSFAPALPESEGGLAQNERIGFMPKLISFNSITVADQDILIFKSGSKKVSDHKEADTFMAMDHEFYYTLTPELKKTNKGEELIYIQEAWYFHNIGEVPFVWLPGRTKKTKATGTFRESFLAAGFEHMDEALCAISDDQAVRRQHSYPHMIMAEIDCPTCEGTGKCEGSKCESCTGSGKIQNPHPYQTITVPAEKENFGEKYISPVIQYAYPGVDIMEFGHKVAFDTFYKNGFRVMGLKAFTDVQESGEAKRLRLEDLQDRLHESGEKAAKFIEAMMLFLEKLLKSGRGISEIIQPKISRPKTYSVLDRQTIIQQIQDSKGIGRLASSRLMYITERGDTDLNNRIAELATLYAPLINAAPDEMQMKVNSGAYSADDIKRADYAFRVFEKLSYEDVDLLSIDEAEAFSLADQQLQRWGIIQVDLQDFRPVNENKLSQTVGGVQAAVQINAALAQGEITRKAAENMLITFYGFSLEQAQNLIDVPEPTTQDDI